MESSLLTSTSPVKQVLSEYNKLSERGFSGEVLASSLERLDELVGARGNQPRVYADYSVPEMDQSWRMNKVAEDLKFGLTSPHANFSPAAMARVSRSLGSLEYKNSELVSLWLDRVEHLLTTESHAEQPVASPTFEQAMYGDQRNFSPRYHVFQGFMSDSEFQGHLKTLLEFKTDYQRPQVAEDVQEIEEVMSRLI